MSNDDLIFEAVGDLFAVMDKHRSRLRRCPVCGRKDVQFGTHDSRRGYTTSASCRKPGCGHSATSNGAEALYLEWSESRPPEPGTIEEL
jgi:hypothetical protein